MTLNENMKILLNRAIAFIIGGLLVFAVMSLTVVKDAKSKNVELSATLDTSRYEAGRLLNDAKAQFASHDYTKARESLQTLFENQPGSTESVEGKMLLASVESAEKASNMRWEKALPAVRQEWTTAMATELRKQWDADRAKLDSGLQKTVNDAWEKAMPEVRADWEETQQ